MDLRKFLRILSGKELKSRLINKYYSNYFNFVSAKDYIEANKENSKIYTLQNNLKVFILNDMKIGGKPALIFKNHKQILKESFFYKNHFKTFCPNTRHALNFKKEIEVDKLTCFARDWNKNYWHFTFEALPIIFAFEKQGYQGKYLVFENKHTKELLKLLNIPDEKILYFQNDTLYKVKECHVTELLESYRRYPEIIKNMRDEILSNIGDSLQDKIYPKNIFIKRIGQRKVKNINKINEILEQNNFETIIPEELSVEEQIKYFYNAKIVISPHGANSTNSIYMQEYSNLIETFGRNYVNPCCLGILGDLKVKYFIMPEYTNFNKEALGKLDLEPFTDYEISPMLLKFYIKQINSETY